MKVVKRAKEAAPLLRPPLVVCLQGSRPGLFQTPGGRVSGTLLLSQLGWPSIPEMDGGLSREHSRAVSAGLCFRPS